MTTPNTVEAWQARALAAEAERDRLRAEVEALREQCERLREVANDFGALVGAGAGATLATFAAQPVYQEWIHATVSLSALLPTDLDGANRG